MTLLETVTNAMKAWPSSSEIEGGVAVPTQCLYPSNGIVKVFVTGGPNDFRVHDNGGALDEFESYGGTASDAIATLRKKAKEQGLDVTKSGSIYTSVRVEFVQLAGAIGLVANASKEASHALIERFRPTPKRNFREALADILELQYGKLPGKGRVLGVSNTPHKFDYDIELSGQRRLLLDAVVPEATSINAVLTANIDVKQASRENIIQRIVYDDEDEWKSSDLSLLALGATVIPFTRIRQVLERLAA
jgi:hypothetical protein